MGFQAFGAGQGGDCGREARQSALGHFLDGNYFDEVGHGEAAPDVGGVALGGDHEDLGGAGNEVDADFAGEELLGGGDIDVAGTDDAIGAGDGAGAEGEGGDGLGASHLKYVADAEERGGPEDFGD